jgi:hypothetical protein
MTLLLLMVHQSMLDQMDKLKLNNLVRDLKEYLWFSPLHHTQHDAKHTIHTISSSSS